MKSILDLNEREIADLYILMHRGVNHLNMLHLGLGSKPTEEEVLVTRIAAIAAFLEQK